MDSALSETVLGGCVQGEDLVKRALIGDQAPRDAHLSGLVELWTAQGQARAQGWFSVVTEALGIGYGHQEQIEPTFRIPQAP
jgi:hypothetical protein